MERSSCGAAFTSHNPECSSLNAVVLAKARLRESPDIDTVSPDSVQNNSRKMVAYYKIAGQSIGSHYVRLADHHRTASYHLFHSSRLQ